MQDWTDQQFKDAGWNYVLRYEGRAMACSISPFHASRWIDEGIGEVVTVNHPDKTR